MFSAISAADSAAIDAAREKFSARATESAALLKVRKVDNSVDFIARFERVIEAKKGGGAGATAAAGQSGGKGEAKKDPPAKLIVVPINIDELVARANESNAHYYVSTGPDSIELVCHDFKRIKAAKTMFDAAQQAVIDAEKTPAGPSPALLEQKKAAEEALSAANAVQGKVAIKTGEALFISWFANGQENKLTPGCLVTVKGCTGSSSVSKDKTYLGANCESLIPMGNTEHPITINSRYMDLFQQTVKRCDTSKKYGDKAVMLFTDYVRTTEDAAAGRGRVVQRVFVPSRKEEDYKRPGKTKDAEQLLIAPLYMWQRQESATPGQPMEEYFVSATVFEGPWEKPTEKNELRRNFGINKAEDFAKMMAANPIPALALCSDNVEATVKTEGEKTVPFFVNKAYYLFREYLLGNCASVSFQWVRRMFGIKANVEDTDVVISKANVNRTCLLNMNNILSDTNGDTFTFINDKVVNVNAFSGNLGQLKAQKCEWRVLISAPLETEARRHLARLPPAEAEKVLDRAEGASILLPDGYIRIIYAVVPFTDEDTAAVASAIGSWKERREHALAAAAAAAAAAATTQQQHPPQAQDHGGVTKMEVDDDAFARQQAEAEAAAEAMRADEEAEAAALAEAARVEEEQAAIAAAAEAEAAAAEEKKKKRSRASPAPSGEKPASQGKKKSQKASVQG